MRPFYEGRHTLVTGGLGFIGSNLAIRLLDLGAYVLVVDSLIPETGANTFNIETVQDHPRLSVRTVDVRDVLAMQRLVKGQSIIFNLAGQVSHIDSMTDPFTDLEINCRSQLALLEACRSYRRTQRSSSRVPARSMAACRKSSYPSTNASRRIRWTSTASTSWQASATTSFTTTCTACGRACCG